MILVGSHPFALQLKEQAVVVISGVTGSAPDNINGTHTAIITGTDRFTIVQDTTTTTGSGEVCCVGRVVSLGRTVAVSQGELTDSTDRLLARATATCIIINPPDK